MSIDRITDVIAVTIAATIAAVLLVAFTPRPVAGQATRAPLAVCAEEDGSGPDQAFPCLWDARTQGNGTGTSFVLFTAG